MAAKIKTLVASGMCQHDVAAIFGINQGRVSDVKNGKKFPDVPPAPIEGIIS
jgi:predicted XRE-type DNA-binding protein